MYEKRRKYLISCGYDSVATKIGSETTWCIRWAALVRVSVLGSILHPLWQCRLRSPRRSFIRVVAKMPGGRLFSTLYLHINGFFAGRSSLYNLVSFIERRVWIFVLLLSIMSLCCLSSLTLLYREFPEKFLLTESFRE